MNDLVSSYRQVVVEKQYGSGSNLAARQAIYRWRTPLIDLYEWALDQIEWEGHEVAVDVGCGNGDYLRPLAVRANVVVGVDLSRGMLAGIAARAIDPRVALAQADIQSLPLIDAQADVALAMHMLYHVPDVRRAADELRRVIRPGGVLLAVTNGAAHMAELYALVSDALSAVAGERVSRPNLIEGFTLENGTVQLSDAFESIERRDLRGELVVPEVEALVAYVDSQSTPLAWLLPDMELWAEVLREVEERARAAITRAGVLRIGTEVGVFVCR